MSRKAAQGHITAAPYFQSVDTPENRHFAGAYKKRFGENARTNMSAEAANFQVYIFARGLAQVGSMD